MGQVDFCLVEPTVCDVDVTQVQKGRKIITVQLDNTAIQHFGFIMPLMILGIHR